MNEDNKHEYEKQVICFGTLKGFEKPKNLPNQYRMLSALYANCTHVEGNLELTWLQDANVDLSFLQHIRTVTGYVLVYQVNTPTINFPNLQTVEGKSLLSNKFALCVKDCCNLQVLSIPKLGEISKGSVAMVNSHKLCDIRLCKDGWSDILAQSEANIYEWCKRCQTKNVIL